MAGKRFMKKDCFSKKKYKCHKAERLLYVFLIFCLMPFLAGCGASREPVSRTGFYFDTVIRITLYDAGKESCLDECMKLAEKYEKMLSQTLEGSDIWKINHSGGTPTEVSEETAMLLKTALSYCDLTEGRIDLTVETVSNLWDFHSENASVPDEAEIAEAVSHVDYHNLKIDGSTVTLLDPESQLSLGFIAKGFIADKMKEYLLSQGIESAIIDLGGNLLAVGQKPDGSPFRFGVQMPFDAQGASIMALSVSDQAAVSSGVYERYFYQDDILYHHILNPDDGYPIENELLGVTILTDSSTTGDALSTTCFVLGLDEGIHLIESLPNTEAVFITSDYSLHYTSGLSQSDTIRD